ncbi:MAG TPA: DUF4388 domain-containing protein [Nitrospirae bacterium]|nr:DUF4388 domain-containing protein [Nitrospirota bacterium]
MALEGTISEFGLADIFQLIYFQKKNGVLEIESPVDRVRIHFSDGNIVSVKSHRRPEEKRIGQVLIKRGIIDKITLQRLLEKQKKTGVKLGLMLLEQGLVSKEELTEIITNNIIDQVAQLFKLTSGSYIFRPQKVLLDRDLPISLDTQHILMDGLRVVDEWSTIEDVLTIDTIFKRTEREPEGELTGEEAELLQYIDGESDVSVIVELSGMDDYLVSKTLVSLHEKGLIEPVEEEKQIVQEEAPPKRLLSPATLNYLVPVVMAAAFIISLVTSRSGLLDHLRQAQAVSEIENLRSAVEREYLKTGSYPATLPYVKKDPWGSPYVYEVREDGRSYRLLSAGPDGVLDSSDDVY